MELTKNEIIANQRKELQKLATENCFFGDQAKAAQKEAAQLKEELKRANYEMGRLKEAIVNCFLSKWEG